jgi:hypothetical protein
MIKDEEGDDGVTLEGKIFADDDRVKCAPGTEPHEGRLYGAATKTTLRSPTEEKPTLTCPAEMKPVQSEDDRIKLRRRDGGLSIEAVAQSG